MNPTPRFPFERFVHPRFWGLWLALGLLRLVTLLPYRAQMGIGAALGRLVHRLWARRRHVAEVNIGLCFPELTNAERRRLVARSFESLGMSLVEIAMSWWLPERRLRALQRIEGLEHLQAALAKGKGAILLSAHFTTLELGGRLLIMHAPFHVVYREFKNPLFDALMRHYRARDFERVIPRKDIRAMLGSLKQNMPVWYAPDQDYGLKRGIFVEFFGVPAATVTTTARFARMSDAPVVPFFQHRLDGGRGYVVRLQSALEGFPSGDDAADAQRINDVIADAIRLTPEQYLWIHRRFKNRPPGEPAVYGWTKKRKRRV